LSRTYLLLLLLLLAAGSAWLAWWQPGTEDTARSRADRPLPDYYLSTVTLRHYSPDGTLQRLLKAERLEHVPGVGTHLAQPRLTLENPVGSPWHITAIEGRLNPDGTILHLPGEVLISRLATPFNRPVRLQTRDLHYQQAEGYIETDEAVTVTSERDRIDAVGLKAWLQAPSHLQFLSRVRAHYEP
jgi:LPS export ABC transporter protein LptC